MTWPKLELREDLRYKSVGQLVFARIIFAEVAAAR